MLLKVLMPIIILLIVTGAGIAILSGEDTVEMTDRPTSSSEPTRPSGTPEVFRQNSSDADLEARLNEALNRSSEREPDDRELIREYGPENKITVQFQPDSPELLDTSWENDLNIMSDLLKRHPTLTVVVEGHAADVESDVDGEELSKDRADVVTDILVGLDVPREQIDIEVIAFDRALGDNETESGRALNRRAFVYVIFQF